MFSESYRVPHYHTQERSYCFETQNREFSGKIRLPGRKGCINLGVDYAIVTEEGYGNPDTDYVRCQVILEDAGIPVVGISNECTGRDGFSQPLVPYQTELIIPEKEMVPIAPAIRDLSKAVVALVTTGGIVPVDNPDRIQSASATRWGRYDVSGMERLSAGQFKTIRVGFDPAAANADPNVIVPLDAMRVYERERQNAWPRRCRSAGRLWARQNSSWSLPLPKRPDLRPYRRRRAWRTRRFCCIPAWLRPAPAVCFCIWRTTRSTGRTLRTGSWPGSKARQS